MNAVPPPLPGTVPPLRKPLMSPMVLSALVYPGAGQLMQRRWAAGVFYMATTTVVTVWLVTRVYIVLKAYYGLAFESLNDSASATSDVPGIAAMLVPFAVWVVIYVAGIIDTAVATFRQRVKRPGY